MYIHSKNYILLETHTLDFPIQYARVVHFVPYFAHSVLSHLCYLRVILLCLCLLIYFLILSLSYSSFSSAHRKENYLVVSVNKVKDNTCL